MFTKVKYLAQKRDLFSTVFVFNSVEFVPNIKMYLNIYSWGWGEAQSCINIHGIKVKNGSFLYSYYCYFSSKSLAAGMSEIHK